MFVFVDKSSLLFINLSVFTPKGIAFIGNFLKLNSVCHVFTDGSDGCIYIEFL